MTIQSVRLAETFRDKTQDMKTGFKTFKVVSDNRTLDLADTALNAGGVPNVGDPWSIADPDVICASVKASQFNDASLLWIVTADYVLRPTLWPVDIFIDFSRSRELISPLRKTIFNEPICNSANQRFDPDIETDVFDMQITRVRNVQTFSAGLASLYMDSVNDAPIQVTGNNLSSLTLGAETARVVGYRGDPVHANGMAYYVETVTLGIRLEEWKLNRLDDGRMEFQAGGGAIQINILDTQGMPVAEPVMLNGSGNRLAPGGTPVYKSFKIYKKLPFAAIGFFPPPP